MMQATELFAVTFAKLALRDANAERITQLQSFILVKVPGERRAKKWLEYHWQELTEIKSALHTPAITCDHRGVWQDAHNSTREYQTKKYHEISVSSSFFQNQPKFAECPYEGLTY